MQTKSTGTGPFCSLRQHMATTREKKLFSFHFWLLWLLDWSTNPRPDTIHHMDLSLQAVLALSGVEVIFFMVAGMGLWFEFWLGTALIIQDFFHYCWAGLAQSQVLFCFSPDSTSEEAGGPQTGWGDTAGTADPPDIRNIPGYLASYSACKAGGRRRNRGSEWAVLLD